MFNQRIKRLVLFLTFLGGVVGCSAFAFPLSPKNFIPYKTFIYGVNEVDLKNTLREASHLIAKQSTPPKTINELKQLAVEDMRNLQTVLAGQGYYDAELDFFVDIGTMPVTVYLKVNLGRAYRLGAFKIKSDPPNDPQMLIISENVDKLGIHMGMLARKDKIKEAIDKVLKFLRDRGKPLAKIKEDRIVVDRASKEMHVALLITSGPLVRFGNIVIENNGGVKPEFIKSKLAWQKGDIYNREKIIQTIQKLHNSRLFKSIKITNADSVNDDGFMDIHINLTGSNPNQYSIGGEYQPKLGLVSELQWEGHNALEQGEITRLSTHLGSRQKTGEASLIIPDFKTINLDFITGVRAGQWNYPGYSKQGVEAKSSFSYPIFGPEVMGKAGVSLEVLNVSKGKVKENTYRIVGLPMGIKYDSIDGDLQPRKGVKVKAKAYPYMTVFGKTKAFLRFHLKPQVYYPLTPAENVVATAWIDAGFAPGAGKAVIPAHKLYYPGGEGSVRGYKFQMANPINASGTPLGGRSMLLMGVGINHYVTDTLTLAGYMDWGTAYDRQYTDFSNGLLWGIGTGLTYHSDYGDLRLDIASPVKRRSMDSAIEFYVSFNVKPYEIYQGLYKTITPPQIQNQYI